MSTRWKSKKTAAVRFMPVRAHKKNCGNRLQSCNKYNVSSFALGHKEIARGRAWSLPIHLARRGFPTVTRKQTRKNRHNWQLSWHHSTHNLLLYLLIGQQQRMMTHRRALNFWEWCNFEIVLYKRFQTNCSHKFKFFGANMG